ncbi:MAG: GTP-binding protein [Promethearchaeota archaeon]
MKKIKLVLIGFPHVGKTSIANRYTRNVFANRYIFTVGCDFYIKNLDMGDEEVKLIIHDIGGQVEFKNSRLKYMMNSDIIFVVFALNEEDSYHIDDFLTDIMEIESKPIIAIIGNKLDLVELENLELKEIEEKATKFNAELFFTSAKEDINIKQIFSTMLDKFLNRDS